MMSTLRVGLLSSISTVDPRTAPDGITALVLAQVYEEPYQLRSLRGTPDPIVFAERLRTLTPLLYAARLRPNIVFSDGTPLTPDIAVRSLAGTDFISAQAKVDTDGTDLRFSLRKPNPRFELLLAGSFAGIVSDPKALLGTGPYMFEGVADLARLKKATQFRLVANPRYRGRRAIDALEFHVFSSAPALLAALRKGEIDFTDALTPNLVPDAEADHALKVSIRPGASTGILSFNVRRIQDVEIRRGLALAVDRMAVAKDVYPKEALRFVAHSFFSFVFGSAGNILGHDLLAAKRLLTGKLTRPLTLVTPWSPRPYAPEPRVIAERIAAQFLACGVATTIQVPKDADAYFGLVKSGDYDVFLNGWIPDTANPADFYDALFSAKSESNFSQFSDPEMERALTALREKATPEAQAAVEALASALVPCIPIVHGADIIAHRTSVKVVRGSIGGLERFDCLDFVK